MAMLVDIITEYSVSLEKANMGENDSKVFKAELNVANRL